MRHRPRRQKRLGVGLLLGAGRAAAAEPGGTGVTVDAICPGITDTDMQA